MSGGIQRRAETLDDRFNVSSGGVLFTTETPLPEGERVELAVNWPAQLNHVLTGEMLLEEGAELLLVHVNGGAHVVMSKFSCVQQTDLLDGRTVAISG